MQALYIEATDSSPKVQLDHSKYIFELSGDTRPENAREFYLPIIAWMDEFRDLQLQKPDKSHELVFKLDLEYMNSISIKFVFEILKRVEAIKLGGGNARIEWHFNSRDEDVKANGEEFASLLQVPLQLIPKP